MAKVCGDCGNYEEREFTHVLFRDIPLLGGWCIPKDRAVNADTPACPDFIDRKCPGFVGAEEAEK